MLPTDKLGPKPWREIYIVDWAKSKFDKANVVCSSFDHYARGQRCKVGDEKLIFSPGYSSNISILRVLDAWIFSVQLFFHLIKNYRKNDVVVVSFPTPESTFVAALASKIRGFHLDLDVRDLWPEALPTKNVVYAMFSLYVDILMRFAFSSVRRLYGFSDRYPEALGKRYGKKEIFSFITPTEFGFKGIERPLNQEKAGLTGVFFGTLNSQFCFDVIVEEIEAIMDRGIVLYVIGGGTDFEALTMKFSEYPNIHLIGQVPFLELRRFIETADFLFTFYRDASLFSGHVTNKIMEYASTSLPIIHNLDPSVVINGYHKNIGVSINDHASSFVSCIESVVAGVTPSSLLYENSYRDEFVAKL